MKTSPSPTSLSPNLGHSKVLEELCHLERVFSHGNSEFPWMRRLENQERFLKMKLWWWEYISRRDEMMDNWIQVVFVWSFSSDWLRIERLWKSKTDSEMTCIYIYTCTISGFLKVMQTASFCIHQEYPSNHTSMLEELYGNPRHLIHLGPWVSMMDANSRVSCMTLNDVIPAST